MSPLEYLTTGQLRLTLTDAPPAEAHAALLRALLLALRAVEASRRTGLVPDNAYEYVNELYGLLEMLLPTEAQLLNGLDSTIPTE